jgi:hypothetical protein
LGILKSPHEMAGEQLRYSSGAGRWVIAATVLGTGVAAPDGTVVASRSLRASGPTCPRARARRHSGTADLHRARRGAQSSGGRGFRGKQ